MSFDGSILGTATTGTFDISGVYSDTFSISTTIDVDIVRLRLDAGTVYQIDIDHGTAGDLYIRIFDAFGNEVRSNDDGFRNVDDVVFSLSPFLDFTAHYTGDYFIAISPYYLSSYDPTTTLGRSSPENPVGATSGTLTVSSFSTNLWPSAGSINAITAESASDETDQLRNDGGGHRVRYAGSVDSPLDVDMARMDLAKGDVIVVDVNGLEPNNGTVLRVFNSAGTQIGFDNLSGNGDDPELVFAVSSAGSHYVGLSGDGNSIYNAIDGTGTVAGTVGAYEVIVHRNPTIIGTSSTNSFNGTLSNDYIVGLAGNDVISGNDGNDILAGGDDNDNLSGGKGNDTLYGEAQDDQLFGESGNDILSGGIGSDTLIGGNGDNILEGGDGNDVLAAGSGIDILRGGSGDDNLKSGGGSDVLHGEDGSDTLVGANGNDTLFGGNGDDILFGLGNDDTLFGEAGIDEVRGGIGNDVLDGGSGNDELVGGDGDDTLIGGADDDLLLGGNNNDILRGGTGFDTLNGGLGDDTFDFDSLAEGFDTIIDFNLASNDVIDLSTIFAATGSVVTGANMGQFIQVTPSGIGADTFLGVDADGVVNGLSFTIIAQVNGLTTVELFDVANFIL